MNTYYLGVPYPGDFFYNTEKPTYYTELLSHRLLTILFYVADMGGAIKIETGDDVNAINNAVYTYEQDLKSWLSDCVDSVSGWLLSPAESRALPVLAAAPVLALAPEAIAVLPAAVVLKLGTSIISDVIRAVSDFSAKTRDARMERLIDNGLFEQSFFGDSFDDSYLQRMSESLKTLETALSGKDFEGNDIGLVALLSKIFEGVFSTIENDLPAEKRAYIGRIFSEYAKNKQILKLLQRVSISAYGEIFDADFDEALPSQH